MIDAILLVFIIIQAASFLGERRLMQRRYHNLNIRLANLETRLRDADKIFATPAPVQRWGGPTGIESSTNGRRNG